MKKMILVLFAIILFSNVCYAGEKEDFQAWYEKSKEIQYRFEVGISYKEYEQLVSDLHVGLRKLEDRYSASQYLDQSKNVIRSYREYRSAWDYELSGKSILRGNTDPGLVDDVGRILGGKYKEKLQKTDLVFCIYLDPKVKVLDPLTEKYPNRPWSIKNVKKVLLEDAIKNLDELKLKLSTNE